LKAQIQPTIVLERRIRGLSERKLSSFVALACRKLHLRGAVTLLITNSRRMRTLNARFRGKNRATDVLSFPGPEFADGFVGDIAISLDIAARNARALRHSVADEIRILALHGLLHLSGYDHEADNGEMARREWVLRQQLGLPSGLIERSGDAVRHGVQVSQAE
jgi:probable rRNA maturation factor